MIAVIPAKGTSVRIPGKNIKPFCGRPILAYSIEIAQKANVFSGVWVSTDSDDVAAVARQHGAEVYERPVEYASDIYGTQEVTAQAVANIFSNELPDYVCCIYATAPMMLPEDIRRGLDLLRGTPSAHYAYSVGLSPLRDAGQFYWSRSASLLLGIPFTADNCLTVPVDDSRVCDINMPEDWIMAERMYTRLRLP